MSDRPAHLDTETLQGYLDQQLDARRRAEVEVHLSDCPACAGELEAWRALFGTLAELPLAGPSASFHERVLSEVFPGRAAHPTADVLQDLIEGTLPLAARTRIDAHLAECAGCRSEFDRWHAVHDSLDRIPRLSPSPGFAARVMDAVAPRPADASSASAWRPLHAAARGWIPRSAFGRGIAAATALAPGIVLLLVGVLLLLNPLLEPGDLVTFATFQLSDLWQLASAQVFQLLTETALVVWGSGALQTVQDFPGLAAGAALTIWLAVLTSGWVLYRNVVVPTGRSRSHVHASS